MLLDTSGFLALLDSRECFHDLAVQHYQQAGRLFTHNYVIAELVALINARHLPRAKALSDVAGLLSNPLIEWAWVDRGLHESAIELLRRRIDKSYSLCDAVSFLCMGIEGLQTALTTDRHFEQEGFARLLK